MNTGMGIGIGESDAWPCLAIPFKSLIDHEHISRTRQAQNTESDKQGGSDVAKVCVIRKHSKKKKSSSSNHH
jgi:hypothetical protein